MATLSNHGGNCCGFRHIHGFHERESTNIAELIRHTGTEGLSDRAYQLEVILSDRQTRENPRLVDELARIGYVYSSSWTGQHGTPIHQFLRAKRRLAMTAANFYGRWTRNGGMVAHPALAGSLPGWEERTQQPHVMGDRTRYNNLNVGDRVRVQNPRARLHGNQYTIRDFRRPHSRGIVAILDVRDDNDGRWIEMAVTRLELVGAAPPPPPPLVYRHPNAGNITFIPEQLQRANVPEPVIERRLILSQFYCIFRNTREASRVFATLQEGQCAYPLARDWHERKVYSDGEIVEGRVQHG